MAARGAIDTVLGANMAGVYATPTAGPRHHSRKVAAIACGLKADELRFPPRSRCYPIEEIVMMSESRLGSSWADDRYNLIDILHYLLD